MPNCSVESFGHRELMSGDKTLPGPNCSECTYYFLLCRQRNIFGLYKLFLYGKSSKGKWKEPIFFCDREIFHRMRCAPAAKEAGKFPVVENVTKLVPVAKWRENSRFVLFVRQATILIGSGEKNSPNSFTYKKYIVCKKAALVVLANQTVKGMYYLTNKEA